jgi:hypothetical protein
VQMRRCGRKQPQPASRRWHTCCGSCACTGNPGGPGHQWVKARYIDPNPAGWEIRKFTFENPWTPETIEQDRVFIPSKLRDNKFLGPEYVANLQMVGSDTLVRAWLEGDWTVIEGAPTSIVGDTICTWWSPSRCRPIGHGVGWWAIVSDDYYAPRAEGGPDRLLPRGCSCGTASGMAPLDSITTVLIPHCANQLASRCKSPVNVPNEKDARAARPAGATRLISLARPKRFQVLRRRPFPTWRREFKAASSGSRLIRPPKMIAPSRSGSPRLLDRGAQSRSRFP